MTTSFRLIGIAAAAALLAAPMAVSAGEFMPVSMAAFQGAVAAHRPIVFHVRTHDGVLCNLQHKVLEKLMAEPAFKDYLVLEVDFSGNPQTVTMLGAKTPATIIVDRDGADLGRVEGIVDEAGIRALLVKAMRPSQPLARGDGR